MNNKYYKETKLEIEKKIKEKDYKQALNIINQELSMPYIPMVFEEFLINSLKQIPLKDDYKDYSLTPDKLIDLLIKLDNDKNDYQELISQLNRFNLNMFKNEVDYFFSKSKNKRNKALVFDILCKQKIDINLEFGNPKKNKNYENEEDYIFDKKNLIEKLSKFPSLIDPGIKLLNEIYLNKYLEPNIENDYSDLVLYALYRIFDEKTLINNISDINEVSKKLERFNSITNL